MLPYISFLQSDFFSFEIGPEGKTFKVHAQLVAYHSQALRRMVYGEMKEALQQSSPPIDDVSPETFVRVVEYMYTGDYTTQEHQIDVGENNESGEDAMKDAVVEDTPIQPRLTHKAKKKALRRERGQINQSLWDAPTLPPVQPRQQNLFFQNTSAAPTLSPVEPLEDDRDLVEAETDLSSHVGDLSVNKYKAEFEAKQCLTRQNLKASENYTDVFLCHAQVYAFADKWGMEHLQRLALCKQWELLKTFRLFQKRRTDLIALIDFTYENTPEREANPDELRDLVLTYVTHNVEHFIDLPEFAELQARHNAFSKELCTAMVRIRLRQ